MASFGSAGSACRAAAIADQDLSCDAAAPCRAMWLQPLALRLHLTDTQLAVLSRVQGGRSQLAHSFAGHGCPSDSLRGMQWDGGEEPLDLRSAAQRALAAPGGGTCEKSFSPAASRWRSALCRCAMARCSGICRVAATILAPTSKRFLHARNGRSSARLLLEQLLSPVEPTRVGAILSSVPSLMMWDDHDIIDGWGSYAADWLESAMFQGLWSAAREHFALFQLAAHAYDLSEGFTDRRGKQFAWAYRLGEIGIVAPDCAPNARATGSWARRDGVPSRQVSSAWRTADMSFSFPACRWCTCTSMCSNGCLATFPGTRNGRTT